MQPSRIAHDRAHADPWQTPAGFLVVMRFTDYSEPFCSQLMAHLCVICRLLLSASYCKAQTQLFFNFILI